jgi:hypothetical protein
MQIEKQYSRISTTRGLTWHATARGNPVFFAKFLTFMAHRPHVFGRSATE